MAPATKIDPKKHRPLADAADPADAKSEVRTVVSRVRPDAQGDPALAWLDEELARDLDVDSLESDMIALAEERGVDARRTTFTDELEPPPTARSRTSRPPR